MDKLFASFSQKINSWCVFSKLSDTTSRLMWECKSEEDAIKLAAAVNSGANICRGSKMLYNNCGKCVKCELSIS